MNDYNLLTDYRLFADHLCSFDMVYLLPIYSGKGKSAKYEQQA